MLKLKFSAYFICRTLIQKKLTISLAESCTGGMLSTILTSYAGASKYFRAGLIVYANQAKTSLLNIDKNLIKKNGAVSFKCCLSMVNNLSKISKSKICVSVTGIAGPSGGSKQKPVGLVFIGIKKGKKVILKKCQFKNKGRNFIQRSTVRKSLNLVLKSIEN